VSVFQLITLQLNILQGLKKKSANVNYIGSRTLLKH